MIEVTSSSVYFDHNPEDCLDFDSDTYFASEDLANQWISIDFKQREIIPTSYLIRSQFDFVNNLKNWIIECSRDGENWTLIDRRINNSELNEPNVIAKFKIAKPMRCRFLRLRQLGLNRNQNIILSLKLIKCDI